MPPESPSLTVVLLMFDEEPTTAAVLDEHVAFLEDAGLDWEIIVVDDGSRDGGPAIVAERAARDPRIRLVRHGRNLGMGAGLGSGIRAATKSHFVMNAMDGQVPAAEIGALLPLLEGADVALSTYAERRRSRGTLRDLLSRGLRAYLRAVAGIRFELEGLYVFPCAAAREIAPSIRADTFFYSFELVQRGLDAGLTAATTEIGVRPRVAGRSKVARPGRIARVARDALWYRVSLNGKRP
jgi:glycosyltransferase involved in cell wall biosynthesis